MYPEDVIASWAALRLRRPVRFQEDRREHFLATSHARDQTIEIEAALRDDGSIKGLRAKILHDVGSGEIFPAGFCPSLVTEGHITGPYRIPHAEVTVTAVVTNKTPSGSYRGYGRPEAIFALERLIERIASEVGIDPIDLRRKMLLDDDDLPYRTPTGGILDSGSFRKAFDRAVAIGVTRAEEARRAIRSSTSEIGLGFATYVESSAPTHFASSGNWTSSESCSLRVEPDGTVAVRSGVCGQGQGTETMLAQLAADALGVPISWVRVDTGDTDRCPYGLGAWGSRGAVAGGGALLKAATVIRKKILAIASAQLEADAEELVMGEGSVHVVGDPERSVTLGEIGRIAWVRTLDLPAGIEPGLEVTATYDPPGIEHVPDGRGRINAAAAWGNATDAAVVEVDRETGVVRVLDYVVVHDSGLVVNPLVAEGQLHGGVAQGIGGALFEELPFDEAAQPLATTFMDYLMPSAEEVPRISVEHFVSPSTTTPLGMKGVGEGGCLGTPAAIANAVSDATGALMDATPMAPPAVRSAIEEVAGRRRGHVVRDPVGRTKTPDQGFEWK